MRGLRILSVALQRSIEPGIITVFKPIYSTIPLSMGIILETRDTHQFSSSGDGFEIPFGLHPTSPRGVFKSGTISKFNPLGNDIPPR